MSISKGILYVATGEEYIEEAVSSAEITRKNTDLPISLVADREDDSEVWDEVIIDENPQKGYIDKPRNMLKTPYEQTLFLDADAYIIEDVPEIFGLLETYELAAAIDPNEFCLRLADETDEVTERLPESFPEYNTGVIAYRKEEAKGFIEEWINNHSEENHTDQTSFKEALFDSGIKFSPLSSNYNCLIGFPMQVTGQVKILHDLYNTKSEISGEIGERVNSSTNPRILYFNKGEIYSVEYGPERLVVKTAKIAKYMGQFQRSLSRYGYISTLKRSLAKIYRLRRRDR